MLNQLFLLLMAGWQWDMDIEFLIQCTFIPESRWFSCKHSHVEWRCSKGKYIKYYVKHNSELTSIINSIISHFQDTIITWTLNSHLKSHLTPESIHSLIEYPSIHLAHLLSTKYVCGWYTEKKHDSSHQGLCNLM